MSYMTNFQTSTKKSKKSSKSRKTLENWTKLFKMQSKAKSLGKSKEIPTKKYTINNRKSNRGSVSLNRKRNKISWGIVKVLLRETKNWIVVSNISTVHFRSLTSCSSVLIGRWHQRTSPQPSWMQVKLTLDKNSWILQWTMNLSILTSIVWSLTRLTFTTLLIAFTSTPIISLTIKKISNTNHMKIT